MLHKLFATFLLIFSVVLFANAQTFRKECNAVRVFKAPKIDGILDDSTWSEIPISKGFVQYEPFNGGKSRQKTEVKISYDDNAIYFAAKMIDSSPDSILKELGLRDNVEKLNSDLFKISILPYNDGLNAFEFTVSVSGVQQDEKVVGSAEDLNWNAIWESKVRINEEGWVAEIKIPFSSLRFSNQNHQIWGINFGRHIRRYREWSTFNFIDKNIAGEITQSATLKGLEGIKSPVRLSLFPYVSTYLERMPSGKSFNNYNNYGLDLKYGLSKSFTLDMALIPDFGQVQSDELILNLTPYEVRYDERRQFFTEGTDMFNKAGIFYSRRVGATPDSYYQALALDGNGYTIKSIDLQTPLINASKLSGRTAKGLGVGFFNAITAPAYAEFQSESGKDSTVKIQDYTNYNILVLDQNLPNNSFLSLINTNVLKSSYSGNVNGTEFRFTNKNNRYALWGKGAVSRKHDFNVDPSLGHMYNFNMGKTSGIIQSSLGINVESDKYDPNDLGYLSRNNKIDAYCNLRYYIYNPFWKILSTSTKLSAYRQMLYKPQEYTNFNLNLSHFTTFKNFLSAGTEIWYQPGDAKDYFETRTVNRFFVIPANFSISAFISPDYRKTLVFDLSASYGENLVYGTKYFGFSVKPRYRINDRAFLVYNYELSEAFDEIGFARKIIVNNSTDSLIFGRRNRTTFSNRITFTYAFSSQLSLSLRLRHYWSFADYRSYFLLDESGNPQKSDYWSNTNQNFNSLNLDLVVNWFFAPGSEMSFVWKDINQEQNNVIGDGLWRSWNESLAMQGINSFSLKVLYYLDYNSLVRKRN